MRFLRNRELGWVLVAVCVAAIFLALKASSDAVPRFLANTLLERILLQFSTGNQLIFDLSIGMISGILMYYLVVVLPDSQKRKRIREHILRSYGAFKENCIAIYVSALEGSYSTEEIQLLLDPEKFKNYFKEPFNSDQNRWGAVANSLYEEHRMNWLIQEIDLFQRELQNFVALFDIQDEEAFRIVNGLSRTLIRSRGSKLDYDEIKSLMGLLWSIHTGWDAVEGYLRKDLLADSIKRL